MTVLDDGKLLGFLVALLDEGEPPLGIERQFADGLVDVVLEAAHASGALADDVGGDGPADVHAFGNRLQGQPHVERAAFGNADQLRAQVRGRVKRALPLDRSAFLPRKGRQIDDEGASHVHESSSYSIPSSTGSISPCRSAMTRRPALTWPRTTSIFP